MLDLPPPLGSTLKSVFRALNNQFIGYTLFPLLPDCELHEGGWRALLEQQVEWRWECTSPVTWARRMLHL